MVDFVRVIAIDIALLHQRECDTMVQLAEAGNLLICARLLASKLVRGKSENDQAMVGIFFIKCLEALVLWREPTKGCR